MRPIGGAVYLKATLQTIRVWKGRRVLNPGRGEGLLATSAEHDRTIKRRVGSHRFPFASDGFVSPAFAGGLADAGGLAGAGDFCGAGTIRR
jgi:hypothetical protein